MCRADLGTGDELGLDVLINMLSGCSEDYVGIKQLIVGGENKDWPVDKELRSEVCFHLSRTFVLRIHNRKPREDREIITCAFLATELQDYAWF